MAFKVFTPGVLTSSDVNTFLMRQAVIVCTSTTRPASPNEGMTIYETDTDLTLQYTGTAWRRVLNITAWQPFTPTLNNITLGNGTINVARFFLSGRFCAVKIEIQFGSTTSIGSPEPGFVLPVPSRIGIHPQPAGFFDVSLGVFNNGHLTKSSGNVVQFTVQETGALQLTTQSITNTRPFTWATGDLLGGVYVYETDGTA
jgi:hypothetical protein